VPSPRAATFALAKFRRRREVSIYGDAMDRNTKMFLAYASGFVVIIAAAAVAFVAGDHELASMIGSLGSTVYVFVMLIGIMIFDPARKFAGDRPLTRLGKILTFQRD
jgi:peptidoglycan/LPS O-acetylase OafA/YrhL